MTGKEHNALRVGVGLVLMLNGAIAWAQQAQPPQGSPASSQGQQPFAQESPVSSQSQQPLAQESLAPIQSQQAPTQEAQTQQAPGEAEVLHVLVGQSLEVSSPAPIKRISVASPGIIDAVEENPNQIQINGKAAGDVSLTLWDETGQSQEFRVYVDLEDHSLAEQLPEDSTDNPVQVESPRRRIVWLGGVVIASLALLAGGIFRARRQGAVDLFRIGLQLPEIITPDAYSEPALRATLDTRAEQHPEMVPHDGYNEPTLAATLQEHAEQHPSMSLPSVHNEPAPAAILNARAEQHPVEGVINAGVTRQAEDLEKIAQQLGERWSRQFQEQAEAAMEGLREELKDLRRVVEESNQQLASLAEAKLVSLIQAARDELGRQMAQAFREQAQVMHQAADGEVNAIKRAAEEAIAHLHSAEQKEASSLAQASAVEERLTGVCLAAEALQGRVGTLVEDFERKRAKQAEDLEKIAQELGGQWSQQFKEQAEAAVDRLQKEQQDSVRVAEESRQQLASVAEAELGSLKQFAATAAAGFALEQTRLKSQYETSRRAFEDLRAKRRPEPVLASFGFGSHARWGGSIAKLALVAGASLVIAVSLLGAYLWTAPVIELQPEAPAEFIDQNPNWSARRRARESEVAQAYWQVAVDSLQARYPFGTELPADPPTEFQVDDKYAPTSSAKAVSETRAHYWEKLRKFWVGRQSWVERYEGKTWWAARFWQVWDQLRASR